MKKLDVNDCSLTHLTYLLSLHYLTKFRCCSLADYNNEFILSNACIISENYKNQKVIEYLLFI